MREVFLATVVAVHVKDEPFGSLFVFKTPHIVGVLVSVAPVADYRTILELDILCGKEYRSVLFFCHFGVGVCRISLKWQSLVLLLV